MKYTREQRELFSKIDRECGDQLIRNVGPLVDDEETRHILIGATFDDVVFSGEGQEKSQEVTKNADKDKL